MTTEIDRLIERVARAICGADHAHENWWKSYERHATAVLELLKPMLAERERIERELRIRIWNQCKNAGAPDSVAYARIDAEIERIKAEGVTQTGEQQ